MGFLTPWFFAGLAAIGLPVWVHLLRKHKSTPVPFGSLMFFERRTQSSIKHRRLQYLLLFALRTVLLALLVFAFANPFIYSSAVPVSSGRKLVVLAIDNSFSMRQGDRLDRARQAASRTLAGLRPEDRGEVLSFGSQVCVMGNASDDVSSLRAGIQAIVPTDERSSFAELTRSVRSIAQSASIPVELHLFSDMQKSSLPSNFADLRLPDGVRLVPQTVANQRLANFAVESVKAPGRLYGTGKADVQATIAGFGTGRATRRASLVLNGRELESKTVEVPPDGRATVEFRSLDAPYGLSRGEIRIDSGDSFPADDRFYFSVERSDPQNILFVHEPENARGLLYFRSALEASKQSAFQIDATAPDRIGNIDLSKYAFVVLSNVGALPQQFEENLRKYVRGGGSLLIALGRVSAKRRRVPVFDENIVDLDYASRQGDRYQSAAWLDTGHPSIQRANRWDDVKFYQTVRVQPGQARVAARLSDQTPLLLDKQVGEGHVLVFASTFDNIANDFPLHAAFVPFVEQTARYLARLDERQADYTVGSYLELRSTREQGAAVEVQDPQGKRALSLEESTRARDVRLAEAGFYDVRRPNRRELAAVNADRQESDFDLIPSDTLALWENTGEGTRTAAGFGGSERKPVQLWWYIMMLALAVAVMESLLGNRHLSIEKETP